MYEVRMAGGLVHLTHVLGFRIHYLGSIKHAGELKAGHPVKRATAPGDHRKEEVMLTTAAAGTSVHVYMSSQVYISCVHVCLSPSGLSKQSPSLSKHWASLTGCQRPQAFCPHQLAGHMDAVRLWRWREASGAPQPLYPSKRCWEPWRLRAASEKRCLHCIQPCPSTQLQVCFYTDTEHLPAGEPQG